eukprot:4921893-Pyramimonas_sp.AAC.1
MGQPSTRFAGGGQGKGGGPPAFQSSRRISGGGEREVGGDGQDIGRWRPQSPTPPRKWAASGA